MAADWIFKKLVTVYFPLCSTHNFHSTLSLLSKIIFDNNIYINSVINKHNTFVFGTRNWPFRLGIYVFQNESYRTIRTRIFWEISEFCYSSHFQHKFSESCSRKNVSRREWKKVAKRRNSSGLILSAVTVTPLINFNSARRPRKTIISSPRPLRRDTRW